MSLVAAVLSHEVRHAELNSILFEREHAPPALLRQTSNVRDLRTNLEELNKLLKKMAGTTRHEKKHYEHLRDSTATRLSYALIGRADKYRNRTEQEEKAYEHAVEEEYVARMKREELLKEIEQAERLEGELKVIVTEHTEARDELEELYDTIFRGFTAEFPDDDPLEEVARTNATTRQEMQSQLSTETEAHKFLVEANKALAQCVSIMDRAVAIVHAAKCSNLEEPQANTMLKAKLDPADQHASRARALINQARQCSPKINGIGTLQITEQRTIPFRTPDLTRFYCDIRDQNQALKRTKEVLERETAVMSVRIIRMESELPVLEERASKNREELILLRSKQFMAVLKDPNYFLQAPPSIDDPVNASPPLAPMNINIRPITPPPYTM